MRQLPEAIVLAEKMADREAEHQRGTLPDLQLLLGHLYLKSGQFGAALKAYREWARLDPVASANDQTHWTLAALFEHEHFYKNALETLNTMAQTTKDPNVRQHALQEAGRLYFEGGEYAAAAAAIAKALNFPEQPRIDSGSEASGLCLARAYMKLKFYPQAEQVYALLQKKTKTDGATDADVQTEFEFAAWQNALSLNTIQGFQDFQKRFPAGAWRWQAKLRVAQRILADNGPLSEEVAALSDFTQPGAPEELKPRANLVLAELWFQAKLPKQVVALLEPMAAFKDPDLEAGRLMVLGKAQQEVGHTQKALETFQKIADVKVTDRSLAIQSLWRCAALQEQMGQSEAKITTLRRLVNDYPEQPEVPTLKIQLGLWYFATKQYQETLSFWKGLVPGKKELMTPELAYKLGESYSQLGREKEATAAFKLAKGLAPSEDPFRMQALSRWALVLERYLELQTAITVYDDIARNAPDQVWREAAKKRTEEIRRYLNDSGN